MRKSFLKSALNDRNEEELYRLAKPKNSIDNPYANPLSWYDWGKLKQCLTALIKQEPFGIVDAWDQKTGKCTRSVRYTPSTKMPPLVFLDANYPLEYIDLVDKVVFINLPFQEALHQQRLRDEHRSDEMYFRYKRMIDEIYCLPYIEKVRTHADWILTKEQ